MIYMPEFRHLVQMKNRTGDNIKLVINTNTSYVAKNEYRFFRIPIKNLDKILGKNVGLVPSI